MTNQLTVLREQEILGKSFVIYGDAENPLFLAKDVAAWIEHSDVSTMLRSVSDEEKLTQIMFVSGQNREVWLLTEDGLYEVLMQSRKPIAKEFKRQVKTILKQIRMTGGYIPIKETDSDIEILSKAYLIVTKTLENKDKIIEALQPKAEQYDKFLSASNYQTMNEVAKIVGCGRNKLFEILRKNKVLQDNNVPYQRYINQELFTVRESVIQKGNALINTATTYVSAKGVEWIEKLLATRASNLTI